MFRWCGTPSIGPRGRRRPEEAPLQLPRFEVDHHHGPIGDPDHRPYGNGVLLWFEIDDFDATMARVADMKADVVRAEAPPYKYVSVEDPIVAIEASEVERDIRPLARRYLGVKGGDQYVATARDVFDDNVLVRMRPERWLTADYAKSQG